MSWATGRRALVISIMVAIVIAIAVIIAIPFFIKAPTCFDNRQNGTETGVDCGGSCSTLCSAQESPATVRFVRALTPLVGRTDIIAYIDNPNTDAQVKGARATVEIYDANHDLLIAHTFSVDLPPSSTVPIFIPDFYRGSATVSQAFLTLDRASLVWTHAGTRAVLPTAGNAQFSDDTQHPRVTATLTNPSARTLYNSTVIAVIYDAQNAIIGASQTVVTTLPSQGTAALIFTWNQPFPSTPVRAELLTVPSLAGLR